MFKHLLVPLDGSRLAEAILPDARAMAERLKARLTLLHIIEKKAPATVHGERHLANVREAEAYLTALSQPPTWIGGQHGADGWHVHEDQPQGVAQMIVGQAAELGADLIVLSTHGRGGLREKLLGSIAQQVVHEGRVPTLLIRAQDEGGRDPLAIQNILLPLDGERVHETAVPVAGALAEAWDASVHLFSVVPTVETLTGQESTPGVVMPNAMRAVLDLADRGALEYLQRVRAQLRVPTTTDVARGDPAKCIAQAARQTRADLLVMATHGRMGLGAFWSASVAPKVLNEFKGPLLLLRAARE